MSSFKASSFKPGDHVYFAVHYSSDVEDYVMFAHRPDQKFLAQQSYDLCEVPYRIVTIEPIPSSVGESFQIFAERIEQRALAQLGAPPRVKLEAHTWRWSWSSIQPGDLVVFDPTYRLKEQQEAAATEYAYFDFNGLEYVLQNRGRSVRVHDVEVAPELGFDIVTVIDKGELRGGPSYDYRVWSACNDCPSRKCDAICALTDHLQQPTTEP